MPKIIDERVVEMKFDNKQFEQNAQNSLKTLDNLKKSLNFNGAVKGLQQFEKASNGINLSGMESAIQTVQNRFSTLGVMGDQIIRRLTDSALNMARRMGQEFTIKPMQTGFQEYETQINAVQTIMANTGAPIEDVNAALDELNAYADKTIYNFTEMTRNIGTFTAAGVDMDTSVGAIKGIANLAAISGSSSQQASTAMYQLSQALASGTVKLMDWNSVVNAGMGGQVFQDALKDTARLHGIAIDQMIEEQGSFRETLQYGWISSEILTETLAKFTGDLSEEQLRSMGYTEEQARKIYEMGVTANDAATKVKTFTQLFDTLAEARQSGWTQSWEIIIGDFEEAKGLLTTISERFNEAIGDSANARNLVLQQWSDLGGRTLLIESVINVLDTLDGIVLSVKEAFHDIFPEVTAENLFDITARIWEVTDSLKNLFLFVKQDHYSIADTSVGEMLDKDTFVFLGPILDSISRIFRGFFAVIDSGIYVISNFGKIILSLFNLVLPIGFGVLDIFASVGDYLSIIRDSIKDGSLLASGFALFESVILALQDSFNQLLSVFMTTEEKLKGVVPNIKTALKNITAPVTNFAKNFYKTLVEKGYISKAIDFFKNAILAILMVVPLAISGLASLLEKVKTYIKESQLIEKVTAKVSSVVKNLVGKIKLGYNAIRDFLKAAKDFIKTNIKFSDIGKKIKDFFAPVVESISGFWKTLVTTFNEAKGIDISSISGIFEKIKAKIAPFKRMFTELYSPIEGIKKIGLAIQNLFNNLKTAIISGWESIPDVFKDITSGFVSGVKSFVSSAVSAIKELVGKVSFGDAIKLIGLTSALINIWSFTRGLKNMVKGVSDIIKNFKENILQTIQNIDSEKIKFSIADSVLKIVAALGILVIALWGISKIDQNRLDQSVGVLAGLAVGMLAFVFVLKKITKSGDKEISASGSALLKIAGSLAILVFAIDQLSKIDSDTLKEGLVRLVELLGILGIFTKLAAVPKGGGLSGYFGLAISVVILAQELKDLAGIDDNALKKGLKGMAGLLLELAIFSRLSKGSNFSGAGKRNPPFIKMAISVAIFAQVLKGLSSMRDDQIIQGLKAMGGILLEIGVFSRLMSGTKFNFKDTGLMLVSLGGSLFVFTEAIKKIANVSGAKMVAFGISFAAVMVSLALAFKIFSGIPIGHGISGVINLGIFAAGIVGVFEMLGWLTTISGFRDNLTAAGDALGAIGTGIGKFIQGVFNPGGGNTPSFSFTGLGEDLNGFITKAAPFFDKIFSFTSEDITNFSTLATAIGTFMTSAMKSAGVNSEGNFISIGTALGQLAEGLADYSEKVKAVDTKAIANTQPALQMLSDIWGGLPAIEGLVQSIIGRQSLSTFANGMDDLGEGLKSYSINATKVSPLAVERTEGCLKMLSDIWEGLPRIGGVVGWFAGDRDLSAFGEGLSSLAVGLSDYSVKAVRVNRTAVEGTKTCLEMLSDIWEGLPRIGGVVGWFSGDRDLAGFGNSLKDLGAGLQRYSLHAEKVNANATVGTKESLLIIEDIYNNLTPIGGVVGFIEGDPNMSSFANGIESMGSGLKKYSDAVADVDSDKVESSAKALSALAGIYDIIPNLGGLAGKIEGEQDIGKMGEQLPILGRGLSAFYESLGETTDFSNVSSAATALKDLAGIYDFVPEIGGVFSLFGGEQDLGAFGTQMSTLGQNMSTFVGYFTGEEYPKMTEGMKNASGIFDSLRQLFTDGSGEIAIPDYSQAITNFTDLLDLVIIALEPYTVSFYGVGSNLMVNLTDGANSVSDYPVTTFTTTLNSCIRSLDSYVDDFYIIGQNYGIGIANGIASQAASAIAAANRIANAAINASKKGFNEHSPSKEGYQIGAFFTEGIANGMLRVADLTNRAADQISSEAIHSAQTAISMINSIVEAGDVAPTITPVLDLSNIASGAGQINGLLGRTKTLTAEAINIRSLNHRAMSLQSGINQNGTMGRNDNRDVVEAIHSLGSRIDTLNEDIRNLKLVLNTGVLAGELEPEINRRLGLRMSYEERGV